MSMPLNHHEIEFLRWIQQNRPVMKNLLHMQRSRINNAVAMGCAIVDGSGIARLTHKGESLVDQKTVAIAHDAAVLPFERRQ